MERATITVTHDGVEITYAETSNQWRFELRGKERFTESLKKAKEIISTPEKAKKVPFARMHAFMKTNSWENTNFEKVEVTSVAETHYGGTQVWIVRKKDGTREKVALSQVYAPSPENGELIAAYDRLQLQIEELEKLRDEQQAQLTVVVLPEEWNRG